MKKTMMVLLVCLAAPLQANAASGEVCRTEGVSSGQQITESNTTVFRCPNLGNVTIPQIYEKGFRVAHVFAGAEGDTPATMKVSTVIIIENLSSGARTP